MIIVISLVLSLYSCEEKTKKRTIISLELFVLQQFGREVGCAGLNSVRKITMTIFHDEVESYL